MSWNKRRCRVGVAKITLDGVGGAQTFTWKDPETVDGEAPVTIELERAPKAYTVERTTRGGSGTGWTIAVTKNGGTITPDTNGDTSVLRIVGRVDE